MKTSTSPTFRNMCRITFRYFFNEINDVTQFRMNCQLSHARTRARIATRNNHKYSASLFHADMRYIVDFKGLIVERNEEHGCFDKEHTERRTIRCTPDNEPEFRALLQDWPELRAYVKDLHADGLLSGLRAVSVTLTGTPAAVAGGVGAVRAARASMASKTQPEETSCKSV